MAIFSRGFEENWLLLGTKWLLSNAMELLLCVDKAIIYHRSLYLLLKTRDPKHPSYWYPVGNGMSSKTHIAKNLHLLESRRRPYGGERDLWNSSVSARHETKQKYRPRTQFGNPGRVQRNRSLESCYKVTQVILIYVWWRYFSWHKEDELLEPRPIIYFYFLVPRSWHEAFNGRSCCEFI